MARFYGWTPQMIADLEVDEFSQYFNGMRQIEAQEHLMDISITSYPHSDKEGRGKLHKQLHELGYPNDKEKAPMSTSRLAHILRTFGRG